MISNYFKLSSATTTLKSNELGYRLSTLPLSDCRAHTSGIVSTTTSPIPEDCSARAFQFCPLSVNSPSDNPVITPTRTCAPESVNPISPLKHANHLLTSHPSFCPIHTSTPQSSIQQSSPKIIQMEICLLSVSLRTFQKPQTPS
jgi:hypothetical protein